MDSFVVVPVHPLGGLAFDLAQSCPVPGARTRGDALGLVQPDRGLYEGVVQRITDRADRPGDPGFGEFFGERQSGICEPASEWWIRPLAVNSLLARRRVAKAWVVSTGGSN